MLPKRRWWSRTSHPGRLLAFAGYGLLLFGGFAGWGFLRLNGDAVLYYALVEAQASSAPVTAESYLDTLEPARMMFKIVPWRWHPAVIYPPGMAWVSAPGAWFGDRFLDRVSRTGRLRYPYPAGRLLGVLLFHLMLTWIAMVLLHRMIEAWTDVGPKPAFAAVVFAFLGTPWGYYATRQILYSHAPELALLILGLYGLRLAEGSHPWRGWAGGILTGAAWSLALATRYSAIAWIAPMGILGVRHLRRSRTADPWRWAAAVLPAGLPAVLSILTYHAEYFTSPWRTGYAPILFTWHYPWKEALAMTGFRLWAVGFHPVRGLFLWHPIALPALAGLRKARGWLRAWPLATLIGPWLLLTFYTDWWAGVSCGQRLLLETAPGFAFGLAWFLNRRSRPGLALAVLAVLWNLTLTAGFVAGSWRGYNDGRLGERYPFYHVLAKMASDPGATLQAFLQQTWRSPDHVRRGFAFRPSHAPAEPTIHAHVREGHRYLSWVSRNPRPASTAVVIQVFQGRDPVFPRRWVMTAVAAAEDLLPGLHYWRLRLGYPSPFLRLELDDHPLEIRRHHENMGRFLSPPLEHRVLVDITTYHLRRHTYDVQQIAIPWRKPFVAGLPCRTVSYSFLVGRVQEWHAPGYGRLLIWARPDLSPPWFQGAFLSAPGQIVRIPVRPLQIARQAYIGGVEFCFDADPSLAPSPLSR